MKRLFALSMMSLALAGCAQTKGALPRGASYPPSPVAITPVPSIYDTINQGTGGKALAQTAMKNPDDPQWSGRAQVSVAARPVPPGAPPMPTGPAAAPAPGSPPAATGVIAGDPGPRVAGPAAVGPAAAGVIAADPAIAGPAVAAPVVAGTIAAGLPQPPAEPMGAPPAQAAAVAPAALSSNAAQGPDALAGSPSMMAGPVSTEPPGQSLPTLPGESPAGPAVAPAAATRAVASGPGGNDGGSVPLGLSPAATKPVSAPSPELAASPSPAPAPVAAAPAPAGPAPKRMADPLLGPDPDLMPSLPDAQTVKSAPTQEPPPAGPPSLEPAPAALPAGSPSPGPAQPPAAEPGATGNALPLEAPASPEKTGAASKPANAGLAAADLPLESAPPASQVVPATRAMAAAQARAREDPHVILTSAHEPESDVKKRRYPRKGGGSPVARVGDEVITVHDLVQATRELKRKSPAPQSDAFDSAQALELRQRDDAFVRKALADLIDRSVLVQEAKRHIKDKQMLERAYEAADAYWRENEILPLQRRYNVDTDAKLRQRLAEEGRSLEGMRDEFRQGFLARSYLLEKIKDRLNVELPDLLKYYNEHVYQHEFDRPAQITWRELVVEIARHTSPEEARRKANALLERVRAGEDFAKLARTESEGPTSSRNQGGLMRTTPGSYAIKPINDTLGSLPLGQVSGVIEGPDSFHIIKMEKRRPAGPASFEEVQDTIKPMLVAKKSQEACEGFLAKLKRDAIIIVYDLDANNMDKPAR